MPAKRAQKTRSQPELDKLPPHDPAAEQGVLGCILDSWQCMGDARARLANCNGVFYEQQNQAIWETMLKMEDSKIMPLTVWQRLKSEKRLEDAGGFAYLANLPNKIPSSAAIGNFLDILTEKYRLRRYMQTCAEAIRIVQDNEHDSEEALWLVKSSLSNLISGSFEPSELGTIFKPSQLDKFDASNDPNCLIGNRWACRGGKILFIGPSGRGKSTFAMQMAILFALGIPLFGITPKFPLSSVMFGDENDEGDLAQMFQGVRDGLNLSKDWDEDKYVKLDAMCDFCYCPCTAGDRFISLAEQYLVRNPKDLAFLDPLVSFADVDITRQEGAAKFLRQGLSAISARTGVCWVIMHHTTKTSKDPKFKSSWRLSDYQYAGAGSYDISGWARAVISIDEVSDDTFRLIFPKRGKRSGACHPDGRPSEIIWIRHGAGMNWEQINPPEESEPGEAKPKEKKKSKVETIASSNIHDVLSKIPTEGESANALGRRFHAWSIKHKMPLGETKCRTDLLYELGSDQRGMLRFDEINKLWFKGPNV